MNVPDKWFKKIIKKKVGKLDFNDMCQKALDLATERAILFQNSNPPYVDLVSFGNVLGSGSKKHQMKYIEFLDTIKVPYEFSDLNEQAEFGFYFKKPINSMEVISGLEFGGKNLESFCLDEGRQGLRRLRISHPFNAAYGEKNSFNNYRVLSGLFSDNEDSTRIIISNGVFFDSDKKILVKDPSMFK